MSRTHILGIQELYIGIYEESAASQNFYLCECLNVNEIFNKHEIKKDYIQTIKKTVEVSQVARLCVKGQG